MATRRTTRRADSILGSVCGLGLAAAAWSVLRSPSVADPTGWLLVASGLPIGSTRYPLPGRARRHLTLAFVLLCLLTYGAGTAVLARVAIWVVGQVGGRRGRAAERIGDIYELAAGTAVTVLASLGYLGVGGPIPFTPAASAWVGVAAFVALYTVADRVSAGLAREIPRTPTENERWPGWPRMLVGNVAGGAMASALGLFYDAVSAAVWLVPLVVGSILFWGPRVARERGRATRPTGPTDRAIARALAISLADDKAPPLRLRRLCRIAIDMGRATQMTDRQLDGLEIAAWMSDLDRLEPPPPPRHWPEARRFGGEPAERFDPIDVLDAMRLPDSVTSVLRHLGERWDGTGEPDGLCGARIPLGARVLAVARDFVSMTTPGSGRRALSTQRALAELRNEGGRAFDPRVIDALARQHAERRVPWDDDAVGRRDGTDRWTERARRDGERLSEARSELDALYEIRDCVRKPIALDETLVLVFEKLKPLIPHAAAVVWLFDSEQSGLRPRFVRGLGDSAFPPMVLSANRSFSGRVGRQRCAASFQPNGPAEAGWDLDEAVENGALATLRTALSAPLIDADACHGALTIYDRVGRRFDTAERRALVAVAAHVAEAVARAPRRRTAVLDSLTDPLTGLPNGRYLEIFARDLTPATPTSEAGFGLLAFRVRDLDRVYESTGVAAGERMLGLLARRLAARCVPSEVPVRYGHDLFLVLSPVGTQDELVRRWDSLLRAVDGGSVELHPGRFHRPRLASAHAGCPVDGASLDELLDVLGVRLGLASDRGHKVVPFRAVRSAG